jgi:hypothetical protein
VCYLSIFPDRHREFPTLSRFEFLGKLSIPLLKIESGRKKWYALKDKKMRCRAKGSSGGNPQILLEFELVWNSTRAAIRTLNPKEERYMSSAEKFKRQERMSTSLSRDDQDDLTLTFKL